MKEQTSVLAFAVLMAFGAVARPVELFFPESIRYGKIRQELPLARGVSAMFLPLRDDGALAKDAEEEIGGNGSAAFGCLASLGCSTFFGPHMDLRRKS